MPLLVPDPNANPRPDVDTSDPASQQTTILTVRPWPDPVIDALGHDPRSVYVERFWLGVLGPSAVWFLRRLATDLEANPAGYQLDLLETARSLGLGMRAGGRHSPFLRTLARCCQFGLTQVDERDSILLARRRLPPLTRHQVQRLPAPLQAAHDAWMEQARLRATDEQRTRAKRLALSLFELGEDVEATERQLHRWKVPPGVAREAVAWAWHRHRAAAAAATGSTAPPDALAGGDDAA